MYCSADKSEKMAAVLTKYMTPAILESTKQVLLADCTIHTLELYSYYLWDGKLLVTLAGCGEEINISLSSASLELEQVTKGM